MNELDASAGNPADPAEDTSRPVDGNDDYFWCLDAVGSEVRQVYWAPQADAICHVGTVRPNPNCTDPDRHPPLVAIDAAGEQLASGTTAAQLARVIALHHRAEMLAVHHANTAVAAVAATTDMDTAGWQLCLELADFPGWWDEFAPQPGPLSGKDGNPTLDTLLRQLGLKPDRDDPDGDLRCSLQQYYEQAFERAWHSAFIDAARHRLRPR